jgi:molybdopterin-containing oxidoreductase family iron-sulfur binding subunit
MSTDRRGFLKAAGVLTLAFGTGEVVRVAANGRPAAATPAAEGAPRRARWGLVVDTTRCGKREGCRDCRVACHRAHNVPDLPEARHEVKWIWTESLRRTFPETFHEYTVAAAVERPVAVLCNHCENPPCVRVCPTRATWKRADGIVMMDWHRCIGCRYCVTACPYGARSFNWRDPRPFVAAQSPDFPTRSRGVVEKCNFCEERLARGEPPACVAACKEKALVFGDLDDPTSEIRRYLVTVRALRRKPALGTSPKVFYVV